MNVIDANVLVKRYVAEPDSEAARELFDRGAPLAAPAHILGEVGEVLLRRLADKKITRNQLDAARVDAPERLFLLPLEEVFDRAFEVALPTGASFYDALYVAAAEQLRTQLITADRRLIGKLIGSSWESHAIHLHDWLKRKGH